MTKEWNEVEVTLPAVPNQESKVVLNGTRLKHVRGVSIKSVVDEVTEVTITLFAHVNRTAVKRITVNGKQHEFAGDEIGYREIAELAGIDRQGASVTYRGASGSGTICNDERVPVMDGMVINAVFTGNA
ncbi:multiubiquitin domain-containing protein [Gemmata sp. G18]|uniref:Multiubiquitin domain-containing protein n=1 Tax=Gemmata palustris TaxID=2822762 RepID=A0ABS5BRA9_9BACT|nr:multiubiquitin domain-containing protein [Gemmata palustris]MBP3955408.1 multiubiquitin domain-containing protein [Gemmata palustris]